MRRRTVASIWRFSGPPAFHVRQDFDRTKPEGCPSHRVPDLGRLPNSVDLSPSRETRATNGNIRRKSVGFCRINTSRSESRLTSDGQKRTNKESRGVFRCSVHLTYMASFRSQLQPCSWL